MATTGTIVDPFVNFNFLVEIDSITVAAFHECSGLDSSIDIIDHREGGGPVRKLPCSNKISNIVLKRGITDNTEL